MYICTLDTILAFTDGIADTRSNIIFRWAGLAFLCLFSCSGLASGLVLFAHFAVVAWHGVFASAEIITTKNSVQLTELNGLRNAEPAHLNMILDLVSASVTIRYITLIGTIIFYLCFFLQYMFDHQLKVLNLYCKC